MKRAFTASSIAILTALVVAVGCRSADTSTSETQRQFGVRMAKMNLWREAMFRFRRAVEIAPDDAMAHNNLAVALEANGEFDAASREYREALRLDRSNQYIQKNYSRFVEFTQKSKKRQEKKPAVASTATTTSTAPAVEGAGAPPVTPPETTTSATAPPPPPPPPPAATTDTTTTTPPGGLR